MCTQRLQHSADNTQRKTLCVQIQEGKVIAVGPGLRTKDGNTIPMSLQEGDTVLLPNYGGTEVKMGDVEYMVYEEDQIMAKLQ